MSRTGGASRALLAKLTARKQLIQQSTTNKAEGENKDASTNKDESVNITLAATAASSVRAPVVSAASAASSAAAIATPAAATMEESDSSDEKSDSDSSEYSSSSSSSAASSPYVSSEDDADEEGARQYRVFLCPIPAPCAEAHSHADCKSSKPLPPLDPYVVPPSTPSPCAAAIAAHFTSSLTRRFAEFGSVKSVDVRSKAGVPCNDEDRGVKKVAKGMIACRECLSCARCREHQQRHFAYVNIRTTQEKLTALLSAFNRTKWRGEFVRVEVAKRDFADRNAHERHLMKKKARATAVKEAAKLAAADAMVTKEVPLALGSLNYEWKDQFGFRHTTTEQIPSKPTTDDVTPVSLSEVDWSEPQPIDPSLLPRAPIDYELLAAVFSGLSSAPPPPPQAKKPRKFRNEEDEWGALERGENEVAPELPNDADDEDEEDEADADAKEIASEDEWAQLERAEPVQEEPVSKAPAKKTQPAPVPAAPVAAAAVTSSDSESESEASAAAEESDDDDLDAEFAALEQAESTEPVSKAPAAPAAKPVSAASKKAASPQLAPTESDSASAPKVTSASSWLGSDDEDEEDDERDADDASGQEQLTLRAAFQGKKAADMIQLERSYGGDSRFKLDDRFEEKDEDEDATQAKPSVSDAQAEEADAMQVDEPDSGSAKAAASALSALHPSLSALSPDEFVKQHLLAEKRRALSILEEVAARPGYAHLSLEEVAADRSSTAGLEMPEHSNIDGKSLKSLQMEAAVSARGRRKPDAHYTRTSFADTMEFLSDEVDPALLEKNKDSTAETDGDVHMRAAISVSLQKWMPILDESGAIGGSVAQRVQIEAEDEEIERRKKMRYWKDVTRFDPTAEDEQAAIAAAEAAKPKPKVQPETDAKTKSKSALSAYTPQPKFNAAPDRASVAERDGDKLYEIKTDRLRDLFAAPSAPVSFSFNATAADSAEPPVKSADPAKLVGIVPFKFGFGGGDEESPSDDLTSTTPTSKPILFSAAPTTAEEEEEEEDDDDDESVVEPVATTTITPLTTVASSASASAALSSFHIPSWPEGHPSNPYKSAPVSAAAAAPKPKPAPIAPARPATALRASAFVKSLAMGSGLQTKNNVAKRDASDSSDSDSDSDAGGGFMRSSRVNDETLTSAWLTARAAATHDFKSKNKSAVKKSANKRDLITTDGQGGLKRSAADRALEVLEASEGKRRRK